MAVNHNIFLLRGGFWTGAGSVTISTLTADVTTIVTAAIGWITSFVGAITSNALIEMFVIIAFVGLGVGLIRRLIRL